MVVVVVIVIVVVVVVVVVVVAVVVVVVAVPTKSTVKEVPLHLSFSPIGMLKWQMQVSAL